MMEQHANPEDFDVYALGALDGEEKQTFEAHLRVCSACRENLAAARERALLLGLAAGAVAPPASVKSALMARVRAERPEGAKPMKTTVTPPRRKVSLSWRFALGFAAAAIVLGFATWFLWQRQSRQGQDIAQLQTRLQNAEAQTARDASTIRSINEVVGAPDTLHVTLAQQTGGPPGQGQVLYNARLGVLVYSGQIAPAPDTKSYQLWLVPSSGAPLNAGLVAANQQSSAVVAHLPQGVSAKAFAVTLEPQGGQPQPTGPKVLVGAPA